MKQHTNTIIKSFLIALALSATPLTALARDSLEALRNDLNATTANVSSLQRQVNVLTPASYAIGDEGPCGIVFSVSPDQLHGLEAETQDQGSTSWFNAQNLISDPATHSDAGKNCRDWRMPTEFELNLLYQQKVAGVVGGFANFHYWSSTESSSGNAWYQTFTDGTQHSNVGKSVLARVRAVRAF